MGRSKARDSCRPELNLTIREESSSNRGELSYPWVPFSYFKPNNSSKLIDPLIRATLDWRRIVKVRNK